MDKSHKTVNQKRFTALTHTTQEKIISCLDLNDLYKLSKVNKFFRHLIYETRLFHKYIEVIYFI